jgi:hypothetical protein
MAQATRHGLYGGPRGLMYGTLDATETVEAPRFSLPAQTWTKIMPADVTWAKTMPVDATWAKAQPADQTWSTE